MWEYMNEFLPGEVGLMQQRLNQLGREKWELVTMTPCDEKEYRHNNSRAELQPEGMVMKWFGVFKRPVVGGE
jgi:hypothetical protein